MGFFADIANGTMSSILESKQYENYGNWEEGCRK